MKLKRKKAQSKTLEIPFEYWWLIVVFVLLLVGLYFLLKRLLA